MSFDAKERVPRYVTPDEVFAFYSVPGTQNAYEVVVGGKDHFRIPERTLNDLTSPGNSTERTVSLLESLCGPEVRFILTSNSTTAKDLHLALLGLRVLEQEYETEKDYVK